MTKYAASFVACIIIAAASLLAAPALACQAFSCGPDHYLPGDGAIVPANLLGIFYWEDSWDHDPELELVVIENGTPAGEINLSEVTDDFFEFEAPLVVGESYRLRGFNFCYSFDWETVDEVEEINFQAGDPAPIPTSLGHLEIVEETTGGVWVDSGECSSEIQAAQVRVTLHLSEEAQPWEDVLLYRTYVGGNRYNMTSETGQYIPLGSSWVGRGEDLIIARCGDTWRLGVHAVEIRGYLPGVDEPIVTEELEITLECDEPDDADADVGPDADVGAFGDSDPNSGDGAGCSSLASGPPAGGQVILIAVALFVGLKTRRLA